MSEIPREPRGAVAGWLRRTLPALLPDWLPQQRWFGGKARRLAGAAVEDVLWLGGGAAALVVVSAQYADGDGETERYAFIATPADLVVDSTASAEALGPLLRALAGGRPLAGEHGGALVFGDASPGLSRLTQPDAPPLVVRPIGHEQSNTSVRVGTTHVFKLIRRLREGEHPQVEIGRFLRRTDFRAAPPLEGSITYRSADHREYALGIVEGWVDNSGDGWHHVIGRLEAAAGEGSDATTLPDDCRQLGTTTADLHLALASSSADAAFAPEPVTVDHVAAWHHDLHAQADRTLALVARVAAGWPEDLRLRADALLGARPRIAQQLRRLDVEANGADFRLIRVHGDFHLGQTLKTAGGFTLIDFEGEPLKSLAQRRMKQCALKDVAGMLRSLDYAAADVRARYPEAAPSTLDTTLLRRVFCDSYLARAREHAGSFLPAPAAIESMIAFFELEKALYELDYEINNRPAWVHIPLDAVTRLLGAAA